VLIRALLAAAALSLGVTTNAPALPVVIDGSPLNVFVDPDGQLQARFDGEVAGEFYPPTSDAGNAGLNMVVDAGSPSQTLYGFLQSPFSEVSQGVVTGSGAIGDPFTVVTIYGAPTANVGDTVTVTQTVTYVNGQRRFKVRYDVSHSAGSSNSKVRPTLSADMYIGGNDAGVGFLNGSPGSRTVGGINEDSGASGGIRELTPWAHYVVDGFSATFDQVRSMGDLSDTIQTNFVDNGVAIQWPDATVGYPFGDASFEAEWAFTRFAALELSPGTATRNPGALHTVTVAAQNSDGNPDVGRTIRYEVRGANPFQGSTTTDSTGSTQISWGSGTTGTDTLTAYADLNNNTVRDDNEPERTATVEWVAPAQDPPSDPPAQQPEPLNISLDPASAEKDAGATHQVTALVRRGAASAPGIPVRFGVAGPNPAAGSGTSAGDGRASFSWLGQSNGTDTLTAYADENGDGTRQASEPQGTATVSWRNGLPPSIPTASSIDQLPNPQAFKQTNIEPVGDGEVLVKLPRGAANASQTVNKGFIPLREAAQLPVGTIINADQGRAKIEAAAKARGPQTSTADFHSGTFRVTQPRASNPVTEMVMEGGSFRACTKSKRRATGSARRGRTVRRLWGSGKGRFRTRGRYSSATVRGTEWVVEDRCDGTLTRVRSGTVTVRDFPRRRNVSVRSGRSYLALRNPPRSLQKR